MGTIEGKRHHLEGKVVKMEVVLNLCANKKAAHKNHGRGTWCAHDRALWGTNHKGGHREKVLLVWNERGHGTFCAHLCKMPEHKVHL